MGCRIEAGEHRGVRGNCPLRSGKRRIETGRIGSQPIKMRRCRLRVAVARKPIAALRIKHKQNDIWAHHAI
jgi:hypothetical protein